MTLTIWIDDRSDIKVKLVDEGFHCCIGTILGKKLPCLILGRLRVRLVSKKKETGLGSSLCPLP